MGPQIWKGKNRLLKFCYVPATSTAHDRLLFSFFLLQLFTVLMKQTRPAVRAIKQSIFLDVYEWDDNRAQQEKRFFGEKTAQGTLTEGEGRLSTVDLHIKATCFVKKYIMFALPKTDDLNLLVQGGQLY